MDWQNTVTAIGAAVTAVATIVIAVTAIRASRFARHELGEANRRTREANAHALWRAYLKLAFDHPVFADPTNKLANFDYEGRTIDERRELFDRYEWFTDFALDSSEEVWAINQGMEWWDLSVRDQIRLHRSYLASAHYREKGYLFQHSPDFQRLILDVLYEARSAEVAQGPKNS